MGSGRCAGGWFGGISAVRGGILGDAVSIFNGAAGGVTLEVAVEGTLEAAAGETLGAAVGLTLGAGVDVNAPSSSSHVYHCE